jgi:hypothetical protein
MLSAGLGALVPVVLRVIWWLVDSYGMVSTGGKIVLEKITLVFWPSSFFMLAASSDKAFAAKLFMVSVLANVVLYGGLGISIFYGLTRFRMLLLAPIIVMTTIWWWLLSLK